MGKKRYRRGAHTVTDFKYHFVRLVQLARLRLSNTLEPKQMISNLSKYGMNPMSQKIQRLRRVHPKIQMTSSLNERLRSKQPTGFSR